MNKYIVMLALLSVVLCLTACFHKDNTDEASEPFTENESTTQESVTQPEELVPELFEDDENKLYLYGIKPDGIVLYSDGEGHYFDWEYDCADFRAPKVYKGNFDNNSESDLAVVTYTKNDGVSVEDLRIISDGDFTPENVYMVNEEEFDYYMKDIVSFTCEDAIVTYTLDGTNYSFDLSESFDKFIFDGISYSENVSYDFADGNIYVNIVPVVSSGDDENDYGKINLDITIRSRLLFDGYNISLAGPEIINNLNFR